MVLVRTAWVEVVEVRRARSCAEGRDHCSYLAAGGVQVLVEYREGVEWGLVVDRAHSVEIAVECEDFVGCCENPFFTQFGGGGF